MKEGLIKITDSDSLYFDSTTKQYKKKMHCPYCGKPSICWCFDDLDEALWDESLCYCSDRCFVMDTDECKEIAIKMGISIKPTMEEWNASKITRVYMEEADFDFISGNACER